MNKRMLLSIMTLNGDTCELLAKFLGITPQTFSNKLNEKAKKGFTQPEIRAIKDRYHLSASQIELIFFKD